MFHLTATSTVLFSSEHESKSKIVLIGFGKKVKTKEVVIHSLPQREVRNPGLLNDTGWKKRATAIFRVARSLTIAFSDPTKI